MTAPDRAAATGTGAAMTAAAATALDAPPQRRTGLSPGRGDRDGTPPPGTRGARRPRTSRASPTRLRRRACPSRPSREWSSTRRRCSPCAAAARTRPCRATSSTRTTAGASPRRSRTRNRACSCEIVGNGRGRPMSTRGGTHGGWPGSRLVTSPRPVRRVTQAGTAAQVDSQVGPPAMSAAAATLGRSRRRRDPPRRRPRDTRRTTG